MSAPTEQSPIRQNIAMLRNLPDGSRDLEYQHLEELERNIRKAAEALGNMGPQASEAIPALTEALTWTLKQNENGAEIDQAIATVAWALGRMGPAASEASAALMQAYVAATQFSDAPYHDQSVSSTPRFIIRDALEAIGGEKALITLHDYVIEQEKIRQEEERTGLKRQEDHAKTHRAIQAIEPLGGNFEGALGWLPPPPRGFGRE